MTIKLAPQRNEFTQWCSMKPGNEAASKLMVGVSESGLVAEHVKVKGVPAGLVTSFGAVVISENKKK